MALIMHQCPDILSAHHFLQVAVGIHIEYDDREVVLLHIVVAVKSITFRPRV